MKQDIIERIDGVGIQHEDMKQENAKGIDGARI